MGGGEGFNGAMLEAEDVGAEFLDEGLVVGGDDDDLGLVDQLFHPLFCFGEEGGVADVHHFVDEQDFGFEVGGNGKAEAQEHARRIGAQGHFDEFAELGEGDDLGGGSLDLFGREAVDEPLQLDVFVAGKVLVEADHHIEEAVGLSRNLQCAMGGVVDLGEDLEKGAFAGPVVSYEAQAVSCF